MKLNFHFSWKQKLTFVIFMTLFGLFLVSFSSFFGLKNVNDTLGKQNLAMGRHRKVKCIDADQPARLVPAKPNEVDGHAFGISFQRHKRGEPRNAILFRVCLRVNQNFRLDETPGTQPSLPHRCG